MFETVTFTAGLSDTYQSVGGMVEIHVSGTYGAATAVALEARHPTTTGRDWVPNVFVNDELNEVGLNRVALAAGTEFRFRMTEPAGANLVVSFSQNWSRA